MIFIWLLLSPLFKLVTDFVRPIAIIAVAIFVDIQLNLGLTDMVIEMIESWLANYFKGEYL